MSVMSAAAQLFCGRRYGLSHRTSALIIGNLPKCYSLAQIPSLLRTPELCRQFVADDGQQLRYVPRHLMTKELCRVALHQSPHAAAYVPKKFMDSEMVQPYITQYAAIVRHMPRHLKTADVYKLAAAAGLDRQYCPPHWRAEVYGQQPARYVPAYVPRNKKISQRKRGMYVTGADRLARQEAPAAPTVAE